MFLPDGHAAVYRAVVPRRRTAP